jgi:hypothetical protein
VERSWLTYLHIFGIAGCAAFVGCSDSGEDDGNANGSGGGAANIDLKTGATNAGTRVVSGVSGDCQVQTSDACVGEVYAGEDIPLDIYIMFDASGSMCKDLPGTQGVFLCSSSDTCSGTNCCTVAGTGQKYWNTTLDGSRMAAVRTAAEAFLNDPESAGIGVGLGVFGNQCIGSTSCNADDYTAPRVQIGELPSNASALMSALNALEPTGETPTHAAIGGACAHATAWKDAHPGHEVVILLMTDGKPEAPVTTTCMPTSELAVQAAATCFADAGIKTYVLGVGPMLETLHGIAEAGGTGSAYLVESGDPAQSILNALNRIRGAAIPCDFSIPEPPAGETLNYELVNMVHVDSSCLANAFSYVETQTACGDTGGWYFDVPPGGATAPSQIHLCPKSCDAVKTPESQFYFSVSCDIVVVPR